MSFPISVPGANLPPMIASLSFSIKSLVSDLKRFSAFSAPPSEHHDGSPSPLVAWWRRNNFRKASWNSLDLAFHRKQVDAINASKKNLLADIELGVVLALKKEWHAAAVTENEARYNDFVPVVYGTAWYKPPIVFARNDGNLTHMELLLGIGEIEGVLKVLVNDVEIPIGRAGMNMTGTGWFNLVSPGNRTGTFNQDFTDALGLAAGDPYGSMAYMSLVLPNRINDGSRYQGYKCCSRG